MIFNSNSNNIKMVHSATAKSTKSIINTLGINELTAEAMKDKEIETGVNRLYISSPDNDGRVKGLIIDDIYLQNRAYKNGVRKITPDFNIILSNHLQRLTDYDYHIIWNYLEHTNKLNISNLFNVINEEPVRCPDTFFIVKHLRGQNPVITLNDNDVMTHIYRKMIDNKIIWTLRVEEPKLLNRANVFCSQLKKSDFTEDETEGQFHQVFTGIVNSILSEYVTLIKTRYCDEDGCVSSLNIPLSYIDSYLSSCESCGNYYDLEHSSCNSGTITEHYGYEYDAICQNCFYDYEERYEEEQYSGYIQSYGYKPRPIFHPENKALYYGGELEIEARDCEAEDERRKTAKEITEDSSNFFYCKDDSSIADNYEGFEVVSHPASFEYWRDLDLKNILFKHSDNFKSFTARNCGMHLHMNRDAFSHIHLVKFSYFLNEYKAMTHFISQRRRLSEYDGWANFVSNDKTLQRDCVDAYKREKRLADDYGRKARKGAYRVRTGRRYQVLNLQNAETVEIRSFKGNLSERGFRKNIEFLDALYYFTKDTPYRKIKDVKAVLSFSHYVADNKKRYKNLYDYFSAYKNRLQAVVRTPKNLD